jgi:hypothetical protein
LTNPDGHAKAFLEGSNLSADDIDMLNGLGIVRVIYPDTVDEPAVPESNETLPAEEEKPAPAPEATEDALVPDETPDEQN